MGIISFKNKQTENKRIQRKYIMFNLWVLVCEDVMHESDAGILETLEGITESLRLSFKILK